MTKAEQFLWCAQTALLNNQLMLSRQVETNKTKEFLEIRHVHVLTTRAIWAAQIIPESMSASEAAAQFCEIAFDNLWHEDKSRVEWLAGMPY